MVVPGLSRSTTVARNAISRLRLIASPFLSTTPLRSTSVSRTMPRSAPTARAASIVGAIASGNCYITAHEEIRTDTSREKIVRVDGNHLQYRSLREMVPVGGAICKSKLLIEASTAAGYLLVHARKILFFPHVSVSTAPRLMIGPCGGNKHLDKHIGEQPHFQRERPAAQLRDLPPKQIAAPRRMIHDSYVPQSNIRHNFVHPKQRDVQAGVESLLVLDTPGTTICRRGAIEQQWYARQMRVREGVHSDHSPPGWRDGSGRSHPALGERCPEYPPPATASVSESTADIPEQANRVRATPRKRAHEDKRTAII